MINSTRSGVRNRWRPINACRPTGPPITPESAAPIVSVRLGRSRSSLLGRASAGGAGDTTFRGGAGRHTPRRRSRRDGVPVGFGHGGGGDPAGGTTGPGAGPCGTEGTRGTVVGGPIGIVMPGATSIVG